MQRAAAEGRVARGIASAAVVARREFDLEPAPWRDLHLPRVERRTEARSRGPQVRFDHETRAARARFTHGPCLLAVGVIGEPIDQRAAIGQRLEIPSLAIARRIEPGPAALAQSLQRARAVLADAALAAAFELRERREPRQGPRPGAPGGRPRVRDLGRVA